MPITKNSGRQEVIVASVDFTFADIPTTATAYAAMDIPQNAIVIGGDLTVTTAWNTGTTATLSVGDVTLATRYATTVDLKTAARTALTLAGFTHTNTEKVLNGTTAFVGGAATAGAARLTVQYIVKGRALHAFGLGQ
jgi:hypothetical protein